MTYKEEKKIIIAAARKAAKAPRFASTRKDMAERVALLADKKGVNVASAPYLQDIFIAALDEYSFDDCYDDHQN